MKELYNEYLCEMEQMMVDDRDIMTYKEFVECMEEIEAQR